MVIKKEKETICLRFSYYICTFKIKLNTNLQMDILSKIVFVIDGIVSIAILHLVKNFQSCKKYLYHLIKKIRFITKNIFLSDHEK